MNFKFLATLLSAVSAIVIEATDDDMPDFLDKNIPTVVTMYAPWCGHCKTFLPNFELLSKEYEHLQGKIQFLKIDGDKHRKTSSLFNLEYFPTVFYVMGEDVQEIESRDSESIRNFIQNKSGITPSSIGESKETPETKTADSGEVVLTPQETAADPASADLAKPVETPKEEAKAPKVPQRSPGSHIIQLYDDTFEDGIKGKEALVSFTTTWCSYCKRLAPHWEELADLYANDDDIAIVNVDCTDMTSTQSLMETFDIRGFPTIIHFSADDSKEPSVYSGARTSDAIVEYFQETGVSQRDSSGKLSELAGVIKDIDFSDLSNIPSLIDKVEASGSKYAKVYSRVLSKFKEDTKYLTKESARLAKLLAGTMSQNDLDKFQVKKNIVDSLINFAKQSTYKKEL